MERFDPNDGEHIAWRNKIYALLGLPQETTIDLTTIDLTTESEVNDDTNTRESAPVC